MPPCWPGPTPICRARWCSAKRNGKRCTATSNVCRSLRQHRQLWRRRCCGLPGLAASWRAKVTAHQVRMCCGAAFSICSISPTCFSSCDATNDLWVMIRALPGDSQRFDLYDGQSDAPISTKRWRNTMKEYQSLSHTKWDCKYHVVFIPKMRRKRIFGVLRKHLGEMFHELARHKDCK